jgi:hypothetical protein
MKKDIALSQYMFIIKIPYYKEKDHNLLQHNININFGIFVYIVRNFISFVSHKSIFHKFLLTIKRF